MPPNAKAPAAASDDALGLSTPEELGLEPVRHERFAERVYESLFHAIMTGKLAPDTRLPAEVQLASFFQVSRPVVRQALDRLRQDRLIESIRGSGTYVRRAEGSQRIYELFRLELTTGPGLPTAHILDVSACVRPAHVPVLGANPDAPVWRVRRLRFLSQVPVALEEIWFDASQCPKLKADELGDSMYLFYQQNFNIWITRVEDHIFIKPVPDWRVSEFGISNKKLSGYIERMSFTTDNILAEFSKTWFDPNLCRYSSRINQ